MSYNRKIGIFGGDKRQVYMALSLLNKGYNVCSYKLIDQVEHVNHIAVDGLNQLFKCIPDTDWSRSPTKHPVTVSEDKVCDLSKTIIRFINKNICLSKNDSFRNH